jgi:hypothetical protein
MEIIKGGKSMKSPIRPEYVSMRGVPPKLSGRVQADVCREVAMDSLTI